MAVVYGIEEIKIGVAGVNGVMGASLAKISPIAEGSVSFTIPAAQKTDIRAEDVAGIIASLAQEGEAPTVVFDTLDLSNATCVTLFGGSVTGAIYSAPTSLVTKELSIELKTKLIAGKRSIFRFPLTSSTASFEGSFTKTDVTRIRLTSSIITPVDAEGDAVAPWSKEELTS